jgi:cell wall-associated NlpC family hydrolase
MPDLQKVVDYALAQVGDPYVWGAEGPDGFDCSGLVYAAYKAAGFDVKRTSAAKIGASRGAEHGGWGHPMRNMDLARAEPGDILYYDEPGPTDHVAIYIGNGQMVEAPRAGVPVRVTAARQPTSIQIVQGGSVAITDENTTTPLERAADAINPFGLWQDDVLRIGLTVLGGVAAAALVIVGAKEALNEGKSA